MVEELIDFFQFLTSAEYFGWIGVRSDTLGIEP
jgi:hypothetical protein